LITLNCIYVTLYFYKNMFNVSIVRIKYARSTIGYSEAGCQEGDVESGHQLLHVSMLQADELPDNRA